MKEIRTAPRPSLEAPEWKCPNCGLVFTRRFLRPEEKKAIYGRDFALRIEVEGPDARIAHLKIHSDNRPNRSSMPGKSKSEPASPSWKRP